MGKLDYYFQVQDTIPKTGIQIDTNTGLGNSLDVGRKNIEIASVRTFRVDSSRIVKPKRVAPVIKTIPYVPVNDTVVHPQYNVFNNAFEFPTEKGLFDQFNTIPIDPVLSKSYENKKPVIQAQEKSVLSKIEIKATDKITIVESQKFKKGFENTDWMLGVIIFLWIVFGWLRVGFGRYFQTAIQASYNYFAARRIQEETNVLRNRVFHFMNFLFFLCFSLFITQWFDYNNIMIFGATGLPLFLSILVFLLVLYGTKGLILLILDFLFLAKGGFISYNSTVFIYNKLIGFMLLPIVSIIPYIPDNIVPWLFKISILAVIILYFFRLFRGLQLGMKNRLSIFYLILYLCALEILPVLMLYKIIDSFI